MKRIKPQVSQPEGIAGQWRAVWGTPQNARPYPFLLSWVSRYVNINLQSRVVTLPLSPPQPPLASALTLKALMMCICNLDLTLMSLYKESSLLYWSGFKKDVGLQDLVKLVFSAHSAINLEGNLQSCQTFINRRISLEMGPEITRSLWGFITETKTRAMWTAFPCLLQPSSQWFSTFSASAPPRDFTHTLQ